VTTLGNYIELGGQGGSWLHETEGDHITSVTVPEEWLRAAGWVPASQVEAALAVADEWAQVVERGILEGAQPQYIRAALEEFASEKAVVLEALGSARQEGASG
jgi:hypothetical protein